MDPIASLTAVVESNKERLVRLWAKRLRSELHELDLPGHEVRQPLSAMVNELTRLLRERGEEALRLWPEAVRAHGSRRYGQRYDADDLARELKAFQLALLQVYVRERRTLEPEVAELIAELAGEATASVEASFARVLRTEEVRFKEAALMESILHHVDIGILLVEADGTLSYATPAVGRLLGVPVRALMGGQKLEALSALLSELSARHLDGRPFRASDMPFAIALKRRAPVHGQWMVVKRRDGREVYLEMSAVPIWQNGPDAGMVGVVQTMTDRTETAQKTRELSSAYEELRRLQARLLQRTRTHALGQLASGAAHALNNYLNVLKLRVTLFRREGNPAHIEALEKTVRDISELVFRLQEFAAPPIEEELQDVDVDRATQDAVELVRPELGEGVKLETKLEARASARADGALLRELIVNLLLAARERVAGQGRVVLETGREDERLAIRVTDFARPYSPEELSLLFDPLKGRSRTPHLSLFLAAGRNQVQRWGGELVCESSEAGTSFVLRLPLAKPKEAPPPPPQARPPRKEKPRRVLVVDDDVDNARMLAEVLREEGYEVGVAHDGETALSMWQRGYDAALLDALMPDISGWELAREIRRRSPQALIAMVTGGDVRGQSRETLSLVDAVFRKPVDIDALDEFLARTGARTPPPEPAQPSA